MSFDHLFNPIYRPCRGAQQLSAVGSDLRDAERADEGQTRHGCLEVQAAQTSPLVNSMSRFNFVKLLSHLGKGQMVSPKSIVSDTKDVVDSALPPDNH
jgi:hypothetical protein